MKTIFILALEIRTSAPFASATIDSNIYSDEKRKVRQAGGVWF